MEQEQLGAVFGWFADLIAGEGRARVNSQLGDQLAALVQPGDRVLDLGCGAGAFSFFLEERGAEVTGIDLSPALIDLACQEAERRGSKAQFILGDVLTYPLDEAAYDLAICLGNVILEFPHPIFARFRDRVFATLRPGGRLALEYRDGVLRVEAMREPREVVEQGADSQIVRRFKEYDPVRGAYLAEYHHLNSGQIYEHVGYVYTGPLIRLVLEATFDFEDSIRLGKHKFLDLYTRP